MNPATSFSRTCWLQWAMAVTVAAAWTAAFVSQAEAIDIVIQLQQEGMNPGGDWDGLKLEKIAKAAAIYWEDCLPESGTYEVDIWWDSGLGSTTLGEWSFQNGGDNNIRLNPNPHGDPLLWYMDDTPTDHSEYDFLTQDAVWNSDDNRWDYTSGQWLCRDVLWSEQTLWFNGSPPALMEIGYRGRAVDPTLQNQLDLFSTVIHEIGHELGVNGSGGPWEADPAWVAGETVTFNEVDGHVAARTALMCKGGGMEGTRRFPSAVDIMAVADDEGMTSIDLPRQDFVTGSTWNSGSHWLGGTVPDIWDGAYIRHGGPVSLTANAGAQTLLISEGSELSTSTYKLEVPGRADVVSIGPVSSAIHVQGGGWAMLNDLTLDGGILDMSGGLAELVGTTVINPPGNFTGEISGYGDVGVSGWLINNGIIQSALAELKFHTYGQSLYSFDLDGTGAEDGVVESHSTLRFDGRVADAFDGTMRIGAGCTIFMGRDWTLGLGGLLELNGDVATPATLTGGASVDTTVEGAIVVDRLGVLATGAVFEATALVVVPDGNDRLILQSGTIFKGGNYVGAGAIEQQCAVHVWEDTTFDAHEYDWGNSTPSDAYDTHISESVTFTINSATTGTPSNEYRGTIYVNGGTLAVNLDTGWLLPAPNPLTGSPQGTLMLSLGEMLAPRVTGVPLTVEGAVYANRGNAFMEADFITSPSAEVTVAIGANLLLKGHNTYDGGTFTGEGEIGQWGDTDVISDTTIGTQYYDLDGYEYGPSTTTIRPGVTLTINSQRIDEPGESFDGTVQIDSGMLVINAPGSWTVGSSGELHLQNNAGPAMVVGSPILVDGGITTSGGNEIHSAVTFGNSATVMAPLVGDVLRLRGHTNYEGGSYTGTGGIIQDATAFVNAPTTIELGFFDMDGIAENGLVELHADLTLNVDRLDMNDNRFNGILEVTDPAKFTANTSTPWSMAGAMNVVGAPGTQLTVAGAEVVLDTDVYIDEDNILEFEANVSGPGKFTGDGKVVFLAKYSPGSSPATVTAEGDINFGDSAWLVLEIGGTVPGAEYDRLLVDGDVTLDGTVVFRFTDGFGPRQGDLCDVIVAGEATLSLLEAEDILIENLAPGFLYDVGFTERGVFRLTALNDGMFVPEPSTLVLLGVGGMGLLAYAWRKRQCCRRSAAS